MLCYNGISIMEFWKLRRIAKQVRAGIIPKGVDKDVIFKALKLTRPKNALEAFGFLSAKVERSATGEVEDLGLVSVKKVTLAFVEHLVDAMVTNTAMTGFHQHKQGAGSTAEASGDTALVTQQVGAQAGAGDTEAIHGASSNIFQTKGTITAGSAYEIREHGIFNASTGGVLLDRSVVTAINVATDDVVTWTYDLTVNTET